MRHNNWPSLAGQYLPVNLNKNEEACLHRDDDCQLPNGKAEPGLDLGCPSGNYAGMVGEPRRQGFAPFVSRLVLDEAGRGDAEAASKRLAMLSDLLELSMTSDAAKLAAGLVRSGLLPDQAGADAMHLAIATVHDMDVLLTWNCRHLANGSILGEIGRFVRTMKYELPVVCTPDELMGEADAEGDEYA